MIIIKNANLLLQFLIEIAALFILGYWGFKTGNQITIKIMLGIGSPLLFAIFWGMFLAPKANIPLNPVLAYSIKFVLFLFVAYVLYQTGKTLSAIGFLIITYISLILTILWKQ
ncbi:YrdB family protein [Shimazuella kribbensis]|uniref:YrdB family protein n=1 Tax=Shimazuella kribbensis TaxID=139808 RepID=UPI00048F098F|nr:YrdB family protein [Shimazuella kribbensis]